MFEFRKIPSKSSTQSICVNNEKAPSLTIGAGTYMIQGYFETYSLDCHALIGRCCSIAHDIKFLISMNHDYRTVANLHWRNVITCTSIVPPPPPPKSTLNYIANTKQIIIGNDVWIGRGATIMSGVRIGNGAVIGAESVVTKNVPAYAIAVGNPARVAKYRFDPETIKKLQAIRWWNWTPEKIVEAFSISDEPSKFIANFYSPDLEIVQKDSLGDHIRSFKSRGFKIFSTIADFQARVPIWKKILEDFLKSDLENSILVIHLRREVTQDQINSICYLVKNPPDGKLIFMIKSHDDRPFSLDSLRETDIFVTTREDDCSKAIDALSDLDFKTRYIFDDRVFF